MSVVVTVHVCCRFYDLHSFTSHHPFHHPSPSAQSNGLSLHILSHFSGSLPAVCPSKKAVPHICYVQILPSRVSSDAASSMKPSLISIGGSSPSPLLISHSTLLASLWQHSHHSYASCVKCLPLDPELVEDTTSWLAIPVSLHSVLALDWARGISLIIKRFLFLVEWLD